MVHLEKLIKNSFQINKLNNLFVGDLSIVKILSQVLTVTSKMA